jgi:protein PhnA
MSSLPPCVQCQSTYVYEVQSRLACPECGHEWDPSEVVQDADAFIVKDANGNTLAEDDYVTLIKDLKVKGSSSTAKIGTKVKIGRLVEGDHNIDCNIKGIGPMMLKSEFVKKAND